ncbi:non-specific lipid-transfer protein-like protein [Trifolium pratense]|uniref:Non-specific lipid-transfer protein-like protein n=1 Tax=Trifolium pratense TaxID=57577 RepID=A0A2K3MZT1_TRIPR|nr:non-specific lipid-transfer protein-like protein [Trifolium pratense]
MIMSNHKDTVDACHCILDAAGKLPNINGTAFAHIPEGCGIHLPFNFHIGMNCQRVATDNKTLFETAGQRKTGGLEPFLFDGKNFKKRRILKRRRSSFDDSSNTTQSSSSGMNGPSFLMVHTCLVAIVEALLIAFHNA